MHTGNYSIIMLMLTK